MLSLAALSCSGTDHGGGEILGDRRAAVRQITAERAQVDVRHALDEAARVGSDPRKRILFGDLHVHTSYSIDAFLYGLPLFGGTGVTPPADACDFARYCAELDFFSLNDHAEALTGPRWQRTIESLRECNARAGDPEDPDLVGFVGWEWTQSGATPEEHFGHKNVIFPGLADDELPARPISALAHGSMQRARHMGWVRVGEALFALGRSPYADFLWWIRQLAETPFCEVGVDTRELPVDCHENAPDPADLFEKLSQWGFETLVIPHGLSWGIHAPPGATLALQLDARRHDPKTQRLLEVYSGHGSSERFFPAVADADAAALRNECAEPTPELLTCCWQAGEIIRSRCEEPESEGCERRVREARRLALDAGRNPNWVIPDASLEDWLDCDQPRGAFESALTPRPSMSAQAALALEHAEERDAYGEPLRFRFGLIGSSDNHVARPGVGYKEFARKTMTDARGFASERGERWLTRFLGTRGDDPGRAIAAPEGDLGFRSLLDVGRTASFLYPGGLAAVHATGRDRRSIWDALVRREVYATSGPRILLWFELLNGPDGRASMGSAVEQREAPRFEVRAVGSARQLPGCPDATLEALPAERLEQLCLGECHHPSEERIPIEAIEVVRITPGPDRGELAARIEDPWRRLECPADPAGCVVHFEDPDFGHEDRVYYARAIQQPTPAINGANLRARYDDGGRASEVRPCHGGWRTPEDDDCLAPSRERAWSSPIFVDATARRR